MSEVREVQQARASASKLATLVGKAGQWIIEKATWRPHIMDGTTAGGRPLAFKSEVDAKADDSVVVKTTAQTLSSTVQEQVLENLGVNDAFEQVITEYGGTVPTSVNAVSAQSAEAVSVQSADADNASDPWAGLH